MDNTKLVSPALMSVKRLTCWFDVADGDADDDDDDDDDDDVGCMSCPNVDTKLPFRYTSSPSNDAMQNGTSVKSDSIDTDCGSCEIQSEEGAAGDDVDNSMLPEVNDDELDRAALLPLLSWMACARVCNTSAASMWMRCSYSCT